MLDELTSEYVVLVPFRGFSVFRPSRRHCAYRPERYALSWVLVPFRGFSVFRLAHHLGENGVHLRVLVPFRGFSVFRLFAPSDGGLPLESES